MSSPWVSVPANSGTVAFAAMKACALVLVSGGLTLSARAQVPVPPEEVPAVNDIISSKLNTTSLKCNVSVWSPVLDLDFRYQTGFVISLPSSQVDRGTNFIVYLRVTPQGRTPTYLRAILDPDKVHWVPPANASTAVLRKTELTMSGAFNIGEGAYSVEILVLSGSRSRYKRRHFETGKYAKEVAPFALPPLTVMPLVPESWDGKLDAGGLRLTVLLDAAPINPFSPLLHTGDRTFLLQALASVLRQVPCQSVRMIAFNLEEQREVFRREKFDSAGFAELEAALEKVELGTIPYQALERGAWRDFLVQLAQEQISAASPSEAVIFLGPISHFDERISMRSCWPAGPQFFYFEFHRFPGFFPDAIDHLTRNLHGTVFPIDSANQLALAIQRMLLQVKPTQRSLDGQPTEVRSSYLPVH